MKSYEPSQLFYAVAYMVAACAVGLFLLVELLTLESWELAKRWVQK